MGLRKPERRFFGDLDCLVKPSLCLSDYQPESQPVPFLEPAAAFTGVKDGYRFVFVPGPVPEWTLDEWKTYVMRTNPLRSWKGIADKGEILKLPPLEQAASRMPTSISLTWRFR